MFAIVFKMSIPKLQYGGDIFFFFGTKNRKIVISPYSSTIYFLFRKKNAHAADEKADYTYTKFSSANNYTAKKPSQIYIFLAPKL